MTAISIEGLIYLIFYRLQRHHFLGWALTRWLVILLIALPVLIFTGIIPSGTPSLVISGVLALSLLFLIRRMRRVGYYRFIADESHTFNKIIAQSLPFSEKIPIRVSGTFAVGKSRQNFVDEAAFYQCFETRERVLMVEITSSRFLLLPQSPEKDTGWWYAFFTPAQVKSVNFGTLKFGLHPRPALQLSVQTDNSDKIISFGITTDSPDNMTRILVDLKADSII